MKTINLTEEQYTELKHALAYAVEQRYYEADQTSDREDAAGIRAGAEIWSNMLELLFAQAPVTEKDIVKVFMWRGTMDSVLATTDQIEVEIISADNGCDDLSDEDAAEQHKQECLDSGRYFDIAYSEECYRNECDDDEESEEEEF